MGARLGSECLDSCNSARTENVAIPLSLYAGCFPVLTRAHLALCAAAIFRRAAAESVRFRLIGTSLADLPASCRTFAQRALWAAAILARADADNLRVPVPLAYVLPNAASAAVMP
jgi:hypothetical protein